MDTLAGWRVPSPGLPWPGTAEEGLKSRVWCWSPKAGLWAIQVQQRRPCSAVPGALCIRHLWLGAPPPAAGLLLPLSPHSPEPGLEMPWLHTTQGSAGQGPERAQLI